MSPERKPHAWRGWLFASLPPLFLYGGLTYAFAHLGTAQRKSTGYPDDFNFTFYQPYSADIPLAPRLLVLWLLVSALILAAVFYRWGKDGRPRWKLSSALIALPWLLNSAYLVIGWRKEILFWLIRAGTGSLEVVSFGVGDLLKLGSILISGSSLLLAALAAATLLDMLGVGFVDGLAASDSPRSARGVWSRILAGSFVTWIIISGMTAGLASLAGGHLFRAVGEEGVKGWEPENHPLADQWSSAWRARWLASGAALLSLGGWLLLSRRTALAGWRRPATPAVVLGLVVGTQVADGVAQRFLIGEVTRYYETGASVDRTARLLEFDQSYASYQPQPQLIASSAGLSRPGGETVSWRAGIQPLAELLAAEQLRNAPVFEGEPFPRGSLGVSLHEALSTSELICLVAAAEHIELRSLRLAGGPVVRLSPSTEAALRQVDSRLVPLLSYFVPVIPFSLNKETCKNQPLEVWPTDVIRGGELPPEPLVQGTRHTGSSHRCVRLTLSEDVTPSELLRTLYRAGGGTSFLFDVAPGSACAPTSTGRGNLSP